MDGNGNWPEDSHGGAYPNGGGPNYGGFYPNGGMPYKPAGASLATFAMIFGIASIATGILMTVTLPFMLGSLAILLAVLSKGYSRKMMSHARIGMFCAIAGIILNILIVGNSFYYVFHNEAAYQEFNEAFERIYGESFDDALENR